MRRFCTIFSFIRVVGRVALHGGGKGDPTVLFFAAVALYNRRIFLCDDITGRGYFTLFSRLKFALLSAMKNLKFLKITAVMIG